MIAYLHVQISPISCNVVGSILHVLGKNTDTAIVDWHSNCGGTPRPVLLTGAKKGGGAWLASSYCMGFQNFVVSNKIHLKKIVRVRCSARERLTELCEFNIFILCSLFIIKTILTKCDWSVIFRKIVSTFSTVILTRLICRIIVKSEFIMNFSVKMSIAIATENVQSLDIKIAPERITRNCYFNNYFYKILLNFYYCGLLGSVVRFLAFLKPQGPRFDAGQANNVYWMMLANNLGSWCEDKHERTLLTLIL